MAGRGSKNHVHKYRKITVASSRVYACSLDDCTHYMPKHMEDLMMGKRSICWNCESEFPLDIDAMKMDMPVCMKCRLNDNEIVEILTSQHKDI
jgi:hypothetical protein